MISKILERFGSNIKEISIEYCTLSPAALADLLSNANNLELLNIRILGYKSEENQSQPKRRRLTRSFYKTVTTLSLPHLEEVINLQCSADYNKILLGLPNNTMMKFQYDGIWTDVSFENFLHKQKTINSLKLNSYGLTFKQHLAHLKDLKRLEVHGAITNEQIEEISQLQSLEVLDININQFQNDFQPDFSKCWNLKKLDELHFADRGFHEPHSFGFTKELKPNPQLRQLFIDICKYKFDPVSFQYLCDASPHLERFELKLHPTQAIVNISLMTLKNLKHLSIKPHCSRCTDDDISLRGIDIVNKNLETLIIVDASIDYDLPTVRLLAKSFPNLKHLEVYTDDEKDMLKASVVYLWTYLCNLEYLEQNGHECLREDVF